MADSLQQTTIDFKLQILPIHFPNLIRQRRKFNNVSTFNFDSVIVLFYSFFGIDLVSIVICSYFTFYAHSVLINTVQSNPRSFSLHRDSAQTVMIDRWAECLWLRHINRKCKDAKTFFPTFHLL